MELGWGFNINFANEIDKNNTLTFVISSWENMEGNKGIINLEKQTNNLA